MSENGRPIAPQRTTDEAARPIPMRLRPDDATPVYGTAEPTAGPAEALRRQAYSIPAHDPKRWLLLLAADRAETTGQLARDAIVPGRQPYLVRHFWRQATAYQKNCLAAGGLILGGVLLRAASRRWGHTALGFASPRLQKRRYLPR